jgi:hypothetical protein
MDQAAAVKSFATESTESTENYDFLCIRRKFEHERNKLMNQLEQLHWPLIVGLGALALLRPLLSIVGLMEGLGRPLGPLLVTALISLAWLVIVVMSNVRRPLLTLVWTGITYGLFAMLLSALLSPILHGQLMGPLTNPLAAISVLLTNAIWGGAVGLVALAVQRVRNPI